MDKTGQIDALCTVYECDRKLRKVHYRQYVHAQWNPHPPKEFLSWWNRCGTERTEAETMRAWTGINAVRAFNCEAVRMVYRQDKELA